MSLYDFILNDTLGVSLTGNALKVLRVNAGETGYELSVGGDMLKMDNLSGLANYTTARSNLGLGTLATQNGTFSGTSSGTNTGDQTITLTGEVTGGGTGSFATTLTNSAVIGKVITGLNITGSTISATDTILQAFGKLQNQINGVLGGAIYQGTWAASTNTPSLADGVGTKGNYYVASNSGSVNFGSGAIDFNTGDWAIYNGSIWQKVDNTDAVSSVNGFIGAVSITTISGNAGSATILATARSIYGNNFDGSAALSQIIASTYGGTGNGFTKFTGPTSTEKTFTLPDASSTLLYSGGALGTPASGNLANCTFPTLNQNTTGSAATAVTMSQGDNSTKIATTAYVDTGLALKANLNSPTLVTPVIGAATGTSLAATGAITSSGGGIGYATGAGSTAVQGTSRTTTVVLNKLCGTFTMFSAAQASQALVTFTLTNSFIAAGDFVLVQHISATNGGAWCISVVAGSGSCTINIRNVTAASITEATPLRITVIKAVTS